MTTPETLSWLRALALWLVIIGVEIVHGAARLRWLVPAVGWERSNQIGVPVGAALVLVVATLGARWLGLRSTRSLLAVGALWVAMLLAFEFSFGPLVLGQSVESIVASFLPWRGGWMAFGLVAMLLAPWIGARWRGLR